MSPWASVAAAWDWEPSVVVGCMALVAAYLWETRLRVGWRAWPFSLGILVLAFALLSPLDVLGDDYLFSAHMLQHLLLILVVPPLLIAGFPEEVWRRRLLFRPIAKVERVLSWAPLAWILGIGTLIAWHVPALYNAALADEQIHIVEHVSFLITASIFWWPVITPFSERRLGLGASIAYLVGGATANAGVALFIMVAPLGLYPAYIAPADPLGILRFIREDWGFSPADDQHYGGFLMLVAGTPAFTVAMARVLFWHRAPPSERSQKTEGVIQ